MCARARCAARLRRRRALGGGPGQDQRRRQPGGAAADHYDIEGFHVPSFATAPAKRKKCCRFRERPRRSPARRGAHVDVLAVPPEQAQDLDGLVAGGAEPVRQLGVELGDLARPHRDVTLAEDQPQPPGENVEPLVALVGSKLRSPCSGGIDDLPRMPAAVRSRQRDDDPAVAHARSRPDPGVAERRGADQLVERHAIRVGDRQQELEARLALPRLEPRQRALRDPRRRRDRGQRHPSLRASAPQPRTDLGEHVGELGIAHGHFALLVICDIKVI